VIGGSFVGVELNNVTNGATVTGNNIGVDAGGTAGIPNNYGMTVFRGDSHNISGNVISGNTGTGLQLDTTTNTTVANNYVGTKAGGMVAMSNQVGIQGYCGTNLRVQFNTVSGNTNRA